ncbi:hypothetical protein [Methylobacterium sp. GC_Met_2]|uniref:hypothetical protein n=1 Tax=Methylobacterium sp. GC_Met_2 TaxID=2937376 RepID=UPI00226B08DA|nr:hypothetical protein [Methylobacterium sp. GC_Met_2]
MVDVPPGGYSSQPIWDGPRRIRLDTEEMAWQALDDLLKDRIDARDYELDFSHAVWVRAKFTFKGDGFNQSLFSSTMKGIIEYQNSYYRTVAQVLKKEPNIGRLTNEEKDAYELNFSIKEGSSEVDSDVYKQLAKLGEKVVQGMSPKQRYSLVILIALLLFGAYTVPRYLDHVENVKKSDTELEEKKSSDEREKHVVDAAREMSKETSEHMRILADAVKNIQGAREINDESIDGIDSLVRHSYRASSVTLQGTTLQSEQIEEITRRTRRKPQDITVRRPYKVLAVDGTAERGFIVKLQEPTSDGILTAILSDAVVREKYGRVIQTALWAKSVINVQVAGRKIGEEIIDARIISAGRIKN